MELYDVLEKFTPLFKLLIYLLGCAGAAGRYTCTLARASSVSDRALDTSPLSSVSSRSASKTAASTPALRDANRATSVRNVFTHRDRVSTCPTTEKRSIRSVRRSSVALAVRSPRALKP
eukprot:1183642-Prorocentrum_minimum.AAC.2